MIVEFSKVLAFGIIILTPHVSVVMPISKSGVDFSGWSVEDLEVVWSALSALVKPTSVVVGFDAVDVLTQSE